VREEARLVRVTVRLIDVRAAIHSLGAAAFVVQETHDSAAIQRRS
jgi:hypothetical protein